MGQDLHGAQGLRFRSFGSGVVGTELRVRDSSA